MQKGQNPRKSPSVQRSANFHLWKKLIPTKVSSLSWTMPTGVAVYASMEMEGFGLPLHRLLPSSPTAWSVIMGLRLIFGIFRSEP